ncbi:MAG TPA: transcriptional regulator NanR [Burkholderiaceae bacterium]|nr:transcriptional regulator NanR [Burkholderiaceae bacterium]
MNSNGPIQRRKLYHEVLDRLMQRIHSGEIRPGDKLPAERELMDQYGVGRPAIREALQAMERSGIVEITHGERARVVVPTADDLIRQIGSGARHLLNTQPDTFEHLKHARVFLEAGMAREAAGCATPEQIALLRTRIDEQRESLSRLDEFLDRDMAFHREIARINGNPIFSAIVEAVFRWGGDYYQPLVRAPGAEQLTISEHRAIVDAIEAGDAAGAERAMRAHLLRSNEIYRRIEEERRA